jgi:transposase-like protein
MPQHFLLTPAAKSLKLATVLRMSEEEARAMFKAIRWSKTQGEPVCPKCGCLEIAEIKTRQIFRCKTCRAQFSLTSGTIFHGRKMEVRNILAAVAIFVNGAKGYSALQLSRDLGCDYKTAFVLLHKVREALGHEQKSLRLSGTVEVDGAYFGGYVKPANRRVDRKDRRLAEQQTGKRRVVIVLRQRGGRTLTFVTKHERYGVELANTHIEPGSVVHADEASHWDALSAWFEIKRINHQEGYSIRGACTNAAEGLFSRLRRNETGTHHHIAGPHLSAYATEMAWREDFRRTSNGGQFMMVADASAQAPKSQVWCGYWQRRN